MSAAAGDSAAAATSASKGERIPLLNPVVGSHSHSHSHFHSPSSSYHSSDPECGLPHAHHDSQAHSRSIFQMDSATLMSNIAAGVTVSLINIPLSIALAVASQSTPAAGVITAVWAGFLSSITGGSQFNIMGPTGALSGILSRYVAMFGVDCLPILSITSGIVMMMAFVFNWDRYATFLPSGVAHGFTLGVALILAGGQIPAIFSLSPRPPHDHAFQTIAESLERVAGGEGRWETFGLFIGLWGLLFTLVKWKPKIPWSILIAALGILLGYLSSIGAIFPVTTLKDKYGQLSAQLWVSPSISSTMEADLGDVAIASCSIAFVAILESLISGRIADGLSRTSMPMNQRQETLAVALANLVSGAAGGIPATAALARTALNIRSGATCRVAGIINACSTLFIAFIAMPIFGYMPLPAIGALLFQVAIGMIEAKHLMKAWRIDKGAFWLTLLVGVLCVVLDPTAAIVVGAIVGLLRFSQNLAVGFSEITLTKDLNVGQRLEAAAVDASHQRDDSWFERLLRLFDFSTPEPAVPRAHSPDHNHPPLSPRSVHQHLESGSNTIIYRVVGDLTFISALQHSERLKKFDHCDNVIVSFRYCYYADMDGFDALEESIAELKRAGHRVLMSGMSPFLTQLFLKNDWFVQMVKEGNVFEFVQDAVSALNAAKHGAQQKRRDSWTRDRDAVNTELLRPRTNNN